MKWHQRTAGNFIFDRDMTERRVRKHLDLPYVTEEGLVIIDRRAQDERRTEPRQQAIASTMAITPMTAEANFA